VFPDCGKISHRFPSWVVEAGLKDLRLHDLRYSFASRLAMSGVDILTIKELLGHKTLATTAALQPPVAKASARSRRAPPHGTD